ncbi:cytochrome P450 [Aspergillus welwitschiae]|uniref:Cytochrome P450 n=1 Tax=Aspergillus welwitschiae TaxID=1341132 RepID=A0A3F3QBU9_9EURO|nr:cytochrome P450 [Aspergillus welwitschiae]RDH36744.1 cytochrome P450 [Aspergillus welwitschiae]
MWRIPVIVALVAGLLYWVRKQASQPSRKIPQPRIGLPVVGDAQAFGKSPISYIRQATARCGPVFQINLLLTKIVMLRGAQLNRFYLDTREEVWSFGDGMGLFLEKVVVPGYLSHLKEMVSSLNRGVNRSIALEHYTRIAGEEARKIATNWAEKPDIEVFEQMSRYTHRVIVRCLMGQDFYDHHLDELLDLLHRMEADIGHPFHFLLPNWVPHGPARRLHHARDRMAAIFNERLQAREQNPEKWQDSLDYIAYTLKDSRTAHLRQYFAAHHTLLMFAAHTSTVASIAWTVLELLRNPTHLEALKSALATGADIHRSPTLIATLKETSRRYSGVNMIRWARQPHQLPADAAAPGKGNIVVPENCIVSISPYLTHHDPETYADPHIWDPTRWMEGGRLSETQKSNRSEVTYFPFGAGCHRCPGEQMAGMIAREMVAHMVKTYDVRWSSTGPPEDFEQLDFSRVGSAWLKGDARVTVKRDNLGMEEA